MSELVLLASAECERAEASKFPVVRHNVATDRLKQGVVSAELMIL